MSEQDAGFTLTKTVDKALGLLEYLADAKKPESLSEISKAMGMSRSTAYRLLRTLGTHGYVTQSATDSYKLQIGPKVLKLAASFFDRLEIRVVAHPFLVSLRDLTEETVYLVVPHQGLALHIDTVETLHPVRTHDSVGTLVTMHSTAVGKAFLAALPEAEVDAIIRQHGLPKKTLNTITDSDALKAHLQVVREQGWAMSDIEHEDGIRSIGVALVPYSGRPIAAISISGPAYRFTFELACSWTAELKRSAFAILDRLGLSAQAASSIDFD